MNLLVCLLIIFKLVYLCEPSIVKADPKRILINSAEQANVDIKADRELTNREHLRRKRYLGLSRKYKLNKRYQECVGPGDAKGHCKHLTFCPIDILTGRKGTLEYLCVIERTYVGVCCPDDVALSGLIGSQLVQDLPAGGEDYDENNNVTGCGIPAEGRSNKSAQGARVQQWPWLAALYHPNDLEQGTGQQFCGGALITDTHVLTAAHCLQGLSPQDLHVRLGEYDFSKTNETRSQDYQVAEINMHEDFDLASYENDIAIIRLVQPTTFNTYIWPVCLPPVTDKTYEEEIVTVAGWGQKSYAGLTSEILLQVAIPVWNQTMCVDSFLQKITEKNLCAAGYEGGKDSCQGDSGGPLMYQLKNGRWITIGIVSWGIECGSQGKPGIYTRVDKYIPWIIHHTIVKE
ncbi:trypsin-1-like [Anthonomus grandis grandis]|uniref:trypsin-1-like n=1 Tax=Anthonomus grandis grandis TaxID=2921223 RepID=UPI002166775D|nr:trypsin-1-like [Anthonomus grandis grandis]